jgi:hypothetical protein
MHTVIRIPEPCHENWNEMESRENGRHCLSCCKTVVDFTGWDVQTIATYLRNISGHKVCGRLSHEQISSPQNVDKTILLRNVVQSGIHAWKKLAAIIVIIFVLQAASCNLPATIGKAVVLDKETKASGVIKGEVDFADDSVCTQPDTPDAVFLGKITIDSLPVRKKY